MAGTVMLRLRNCGIFSPGGYYIHSGYTARYLSVSTKTFGSTPKNFKRKNGRKSDKVTGKNKDTITISPSTIQVYSDPQLAQTVRDLAVSFQKTKNVVKNIREDLEDCTFELLRLGQNHDTIETAVKETTKLLKYCNETAIPKVEGNLSELQENVVYFSKLSANQENRLLEMNDNVQAALSKLFTQSQILEKIQADLQNFQTEIEGPKSEASAAFVEVKMLKKELKSLKAELYSLKRKPS